MTTTLPARPAWTLVIACGCLIALITFGTRGGFGLFNQPISQTHGWGREVFALGLAIQNLMWGAAQPFAGALADRYGPTPILIGGCLVYALGVVLMSLVATPGLFYLAAGLMVGVAGAAASFAIVMASVGRMVTPERRSWALGIVTAASSLGMFIYAPLGQGFILAYGWQTALQLLAATLLLVIPLSLPFRHDQGSAAAGGQTIAQALREASGHRSFWLLVAGFFVCGYHVAFIQVHLPAFVQDMGLAPQVGAWAIALVGLFNVIGSYGAGVLGGRQSKKNLLCLIYLLRALVIALYISLPITTVSTLLFAAAMGILWLSTVPLTSGLVAVMFGPRYMAMLFGIVFFSHQIGSFLGVWLGGRLYDSFGSYDFVWWTSVLLGLLAAIVHWPIAEGAVVRPAMA